MMGLQQELMWESLCSMYHAHNREVEGRALNALELEGDGEERKGPHLIVMQHGW